MANITIKRYNGSSWDIHYPKTTIAQVINLSTSLANMQSDINGKLASSHASASNPHGITPALIGALTQTLGDTRYLGKTAKAADSNKLNGQLATYYAAQTDLSNYEPKITTKNTAFNKSFGTTAGTVTQGNDSRLSNARTPTAHTHTKSQITDFPSSMPASDVSAWAKKSSLDHGDIPYATSITKGGVRVNVQGTSVYLYTTD